MLSFGGRAIAADADVQEVNSRVQTFLDLLGRFDEVPALANDVPLSQSKLADLLNVDGAMSELKSRLASAANTDWANLASAIDGLDCSAADCGVSVKVSGPADTADDSDPVYVNDSNPGTPGAGTVTIAFEVSVKGEDVPVPLVFANDLVHLTGTSAAGTFPLDVSLKTTVLQFEVDKAKLHNADAGVKAQALALRTMPTDTAVPSAAKRVAPGATFSAAADNVSLGSFNADLGITKISVGGNLSFDLAGHATLLDPDDGDGPNGPLAGDGLISADEWTTTGFATLLSAGLDDNANTSAVDATMRLDSSLVPSTIDGPDADNTPDHDGSIHYVDASLTDNTAPVITIAPDPAFGALGDFRNMTPGEAVASLMRLLQFLDGLQASNKLDLNLPFVGGTTPNPADPASSPKGTFSDALRLSQELKKAITEGANKLTTLDDPATAAKEESVPTFTNVQDMATKFSAALGAPNSVVPTFVPAAGDAPARVDFTLGVKKSLTTQVVPDFDNLDILSAIGITSAPLTLNASYDVEVPFGLSLKQQPKESNSPIGSCSDETDNDGDGKTDADDTDCAQAESIQQRVGVKVGTGLATDVPEVVASVRLDGTGIGANARIGILEATVDNAQLHVTGKKTGEGTNASDTVATCSDDTDNDNDGKKDAADPDCNAVATVDFKDTADGFLSVQDLFNTLGAGQAPATAGMTAKATAAFSATVPVSASVGTTNLASGTIKITADPPEMNLLTGDGVGALLTSVKVDASDVHTKDLFNFSPCSNNTDDDGDGKVNDGCEKTGTNGPETAAQCANDTNDDSAADDNVVNDGCPADDDPEGVSSRLFNQVIDALRSLTDVLSTSGLVDGDAPIPLIDTSYNDLLGYVDTLEALADGMSQGAESALSATACTNSTDDDHDGYINDGCPTAGASPEASGVGTTGTQCDRNNATNDDAADDSVVNDGCAPKTPTLNDIAHQIDDYLDAMLDGLPGATAGDDHSTVGLTYNTADDSIRFAVHLDPGLTRTVPLNLDLGGGAGSLVSVTGAGDISAAITGALDLDFGIELGNFTPFLLDSTGLSINASAEAHNLTLQAAVGPISLMVGDTVARPEHDGQCAAGNTTDDDGDGYLNDGCPARDGDDDGDAAASEQGADCAKGNTSNDDSGDDDDYVNDGCPAQADPATFDLSGAFSVSVNDDPTDHKLYMGELSTSSFTVSVGGTTDHDCDHVTTQNTNDGQAKQACAVLPLYFDSDGPDGPAAPAPLGDPTNQGHKLRAAVVDLSSPTIDFSDFDFSRITDQIASQVIDMLLLNSGLQNLIDLLRGVLNEQLFGFKLPFIGDQLGNAADIVTTIETKLKAAVQSSMSGHSLDAATNARVVQTTLDDFRADVGTLLANEHVLLNSAGTGEGTADDFRIELRCKKGADPVGPCDTGGEDDAFNLAAGPSGGDASKCANNDDDDHDGVINDGCAQEGSFPEADCANNADDPDEDPSTEDGHEIDDDTRVNDGCPEFVKHGATDVYDIRFLAKLGRVNNDIGDTSLNFDVGVPGLGLETQNAHLTGNLDWHIDIGFGISKDADLGFYLVTDPDTGDAVDPEELGVAGHIGVSSDDADPAKIIANLGFLRVTAIDGDPTAMCATSGPTGTDPCRPQNDGGAPDPRSSFSVNFGINLTDPDTSSPDGLLAFNELGSASFEDLLKFRFGAVADVNFHIETSIAGSTTLPRLFADLHLDWAFTVGSDTSGNPQGTASSNVADLAPDGSASNLNITIDGVTLDAGTFVTKFLKPILQDVQKFTKPLQPLIDKLQAPIPVLSDLAGEPVTLLDLAQQLAPATYHPELIVAIVKIVDFVNTFDVSGTGNFQIPLGGTFNLAGNDLQRGALAEGDARRAFANVGQLDSLDAAGSLLPAINQSTAPGQPPERTVTKVSEVGVTFPFIQQPSKIMGLLFKQDVDLIRFESQLGAAFSYSQKFGPIWSVPPVFLEIGGSLSASVKFGIGYDTQGLRELLFENASADALLHGLYLIDYPGNEAELRGELFANAQVSVLIFSAGAGGSVYLTIGIDLNDPNNDGKLKYQEAADILRRTGSPLCLFTLNGQFGVRIFVFAEVDIFVWSQRWEKTLADIVLFEFKVQCDPMPEPILAHPDGTTLVLHLGLDKGLRDTPANSGNSIGHDVIDEKFLVTKAKLPDPADKVVKNGVTVEAFGITRFFPGNWTKILVRDAGDGNDVITLADGTAGAETQCSNATDDDGDGFINDGCPKTKGATDTPESAAQCTGATPTVPANNTDDDNDGFVNDGCKAIGDPLPFLISSEIHGGSGNDQITGGLAATAAAGSFDDKLYGDADNDVINAREGRNLVVGGSGKDKIGTGKSPDTIWGDNESNTPAVDDIDNNADTLDGGAEGDNIYGGSGPDTIAGGLSVKDPKTKVVTPDGVDYIEGNDGADTIDAGDAGDTVHGGNGADRIQGGTGNDIITGGDEPNSATCNSGTAVDDTLVGGEGSDTIEAGAGDDVVVGGNTLAGQPDGDDAKLDGGDGCDDLYGDNATPNPDGSSARAFLLTDPGIGGVDHMAGGNGSDRLHGQKDGDLVRGGPWKTDNNTDPANDGNDGNDTVFGEAGADSLWGDGGVDKVLGGDDADNVVGGVGGDTLQGDGGTDIVIGDDGWVANGAAVLRSSGSSSQDHQDKMFGGTERDLMYGELSNDTMRGDEADDDMFGNEGDDVMNGNTGADYMFGNDGADDMFGDAGNDRMVGGSGDSTTPDNGKDEMYGRFNQDVMAGDNATITPSGAVTLLAETTIGDGDLMYGDEHEDRMYGGRGNDTMYGNTDDDYMEGNADQDVMQGNTGDDDMIGGTSQSGPAALQDAEGQGGQADDHDTMTGGTGHDVMVGDNGRIARTGNPSSILDGAEERDVELFDLDSTNADLSGPDTMDGNDESDELYGGADIDTVHGNGGDDHLEGNGGADKVWGDADQDDIIGGTSADAGDDTGGSHPDTGDELFGDAGSTSQTETGGKSDVIAGDNASIVRVVAGNTVAKDDLDPTRAGYSGVVRRVVTLFDLATVASPNPSAPGNQAVSGGETIYGEGGPDTIYGQGGTDVLHGQDRDDYLEGNAGADKAYGEAGQDDIIGGTGRTKSDDPATADNNRLDGADELYGGNGVVEGSDEDTGTDVAPADSDDFDVVMGDNATVLRDLEPANGDHVWEINSFNASVKRRLFLYDVATVANPAPQTNGTSGGDTIKGEADADVLYGQGLGDTIDGNGDDDYMEGNEGVDTLRGGVGSDDMLGGTGQINGEPLAVDNRLDSGETLMAGGPGFDFMTGDNAVVRRVVDGSGKWLLNTFNKGVQHQRVFLRDLDDVGDPAAAGTFGGEVLMQGNDDDDVVYGQGGNDAIEGNDGSDYIEANAGADSAAGGAGEDDILGGTGRVNLDGPNGTDGRFDGGDLISGEGGTVDGAAEGSAGDVILGDNAVLERPLDGAGKWRTSKANGVTTRRYVVRDLDVIGGLSAAGTSGGDTVYGNDNDDVLYGQGGVDVVNGGAGDDYIEGNNGGDTLNGGPDQDDLIGGTGRSVDEETWIETAPPQQGSDGRLDGNDTINGGGAADFELGDNGLIQRRENADGTWKRYVDANPDTIVRVATRRDVAGAAGTWGNDVMNGDEGDDVQYGQDGTDTMHGNADNATYDVQDNDDMYGELGNDFMFGDEGEDAMVGDRGNIVDTRLKDDSKKLAYDTQGPAFFKYTGLVAGQLDRRVSLTVDGDDAPGNPSMGMTTGGADRLRGGPGHDSIHGAFGDDLANGDSGGDWLFGDDGADVMWGGRGSDPNSIDPNDRIKLDDGVIAVDPANTRGKNDRFVDYLFGAHGGLQANEVDASDKLDFRPRNPGAGFPGDPAEWFTMTNTNVADVAVHQHHQGIDWIYGGWDRDVMEGNVGKNGPDFGDRLIDWKGAYNMYTRCNASYGDDGDIYQITPQLMELLQAMAFGSGAGDSLTEVKTTGTSAFNELGLVYPNDPGNHGQAFPTTPGHFEKIDCTP
jgi:Ca2+-binding RTX toxin-like protein